MSEAEDPKSRIIILNGTSSAGKTSIAKELQARLDGVYLHFKMDVFWYMVPSDIEANSENFPKLKQAIIQSAEALAANGHNLIIDIVTMPEQLAMLRETLSDYDLHTIGVKSDLAVTERRELARGDRKIGLARSQHADIHNGTVYDYEVDTSYITAAEAACAIITDHLSATSRPGKPCPPHPNI